jgi:hypothetical protein
MPRDDDDDDRPRKKKPRSSDEIEDGERPIKKRRPRDDDDEEEERPRKRRRRDEDEDEGEDIGNSPLGAVVPLGVSIWALASFYVALLSCFIPGFGLIAIILGIVAFVTAKHKATYGSISGNMRAVLGIVIGLFTAVVQTVMLVLILSGKLR